MKHLIQNISLIVGLLLSTAYAKAQNAEADPAVITITMQGPGDPGPMGDQIDGAATLKFRIANNSGGSMSNGVVPAYSVYYTVQFNSYYTFTELLPSSQFEILYVSAGDPDYVVQITNSVDLNPGDVYDFYMTVEVLQTSPTPQTVTLNVERIDPIQTGNTSTANDNVVKQFDVVAVELPVKYLNLSAVCGNDNVDLNWITRDELDVDNFELERSVDGNNFSAIANQQANGNTVGESKYLYKDDARSIIAKRIFYRVKAVDVDDSYYYSNVVMVNQNKSSKAIAWPNPFADKLNLKINTSDKGNAAVRLYNSAGVLVKQFSTAVSNGLNFISLDGLSHLPKQNYFIEVHLNGQRIFADKLIK